MRFDGLIWILALTLGQVFYIVCALSYSAILFYFLFKVNPLGWHNKHYSSKLKQCTAPVLTLMLQSKQGNQIANINYN